MSPDSHVWVCVCLYNNACVCGSHVCLWTASLYIYWNEQLSLGRWCGAEACSHASIYRLPRIRDWLRQPLPCGPARWPTPRQSSAGESRVSSPGHRLGALPLPVETWKCEMIWREHTQTGPSNRLRFVQAQTPIKRHVTCDISQHDMTQKSQKWKCRNEVISISLSVKLILLAIDCDFYF